ncbi:MAG: hypothetical protein NTX50_18380 [Candidatus Sumerlaeota bacterium]|nr:hypothetical protein [Candidatus Sumerlaeota bacterium]
MARVCVISGSGAVALHAAEKITELCGVVVAFSDSDGCIHDPHGINKEKRCWLEDLKIVRRGRIKEYTEKFPRARYLEGQAPWTIPCDCVFPCAIEGEISGDDAKRLIENGCFVVCEGANMPCAPEAQRLFVENRVLYGPCIAANVGGVIVSALEMSQDAMRLKWDRDEINARLRQGIKDIHAGALAAANEYGHKGDLLMGANIAAFTRLADAVIDQGWCEGEYGNYGTYRAYGTYNAQRR